MLSLKFSTNTLHFHGNTPTSSHLSHENPQNRLQSVTLTTDFEVIGVLSLEQLDSLIRRLFISKIVMENHSPVSKALFMPTSASTNPRLILASTSFVVRPQLRVLSF